MSTEPTDTIEVTTFAGAAERSEAMQAQLRDILARIDAAEPVAAAVAALEAAKLRHASLRQSQVRLMQRMQELGRDLADAYSQAEDAVIAGETPAAKALARLSQQESEHRLVSRANQRLVERLLGEAEIAELSQTGEHLAARARALRLEAQARMEKTAQLMAEAAQFEGGISFDPANTLSGQLTAHAVELESQVDNYRRWAAERADKHANALREIESIKLLRG